MLINREVFSLPPYISTSWGHVVALFTRGDMLVVTLSDGTTIQIPNLPAALTEKIFDTHASYLKEQHIKKEKSRDNAGGVIAHLLEMPMRMNFNNLEGLTTILQHNSDQIDTPDLPVEMLQKIGSIAKIAGLNDPQQIPKPEPHCNCIHCQIARTLHQSINEEDESPEETPLLSQILGRPSAPAAPQELEGPWIVQPCEDSVYTVVNRDNPIESYKVYLGEEQVGCNCGQHGCDHILAVLRS